MHDFLYFCEFTKIRVDHARAGMVSCESIEKWLECLKKRKEKKTTKTSTGIILYGTPKQKKYYYIMSSPKEQNPAVIFFSALATPWVFLGRKVGLIEKNPQIPAWKWASVQYAPPGGEVEE